MSQDLESFEKPTDPLQSFTGLSRMLKYLDEEDNNPGSLRAAKYVRSFVSDRNNEALAALEDAFNRDGDKSFTFFEDLQAPGEIVEPLFDELKNATDSEARRKAAMKLVSDLSVWEANNLSDYRLAA